MPQAWIHKLRNDSSFANIKSLRVILASEPIWWLAKFIDLEGLELLVGILENVALKRVYAFIIILPTRFIFL
jgi:hypothetical protein